MGQDNAAAVQLQLYDSNEQLLEERAANVAGAVTAFQSLNGRKPKTLMLSRVDGAMLAVMCASGLCFVHGRDAACGWQMERPLENEAPDEEIELFPDEIFLPHELVPLEFAESALRQFVDGSPLSAIEGMHLLR